MQPNNIANGAFAYFVRAIMQKRARDGRDQQDDRGLQSRHRVISWLEGDRG
jgi:hypothetical protein